PVAAEIEGWSPFVPGNDRDSSLPVAGLTVRLHNSSKKPVRVALGISVENCAGARNDWFQDPSGTVLYLHDGDTSQNSMFIASPTPADSGILHWPGKHNFVALEHFVRTFGATGRFAQEEHALANGTNIEAPENAKVASLGFRSTLQPGEMFTVPLVLGW